MIKTNVYNIKIGNSRNEIEHWTNDEIGVAVYTKLALSVSWTRGLIAQSVSVSMEFSGLGFKSHLDQLSIATSNNPSVVNTIYIHKLKVIHIQS